MISGPRVIVQVDTVEVAKDLSVWFFALDEDRVFCICDHVPPSALGQRVLTPEEVAVLRFEFEMRAYALFLLKAPTLVDVTFYMSLQWPRYFGFSSEIPPGFVTSIWQSMKRAHSRMCICRGQDYNSSLDCYPSHREFLPLLHRLPPGLAMYEQIARVMFKHWFELIDVCPITFHYPEFKEGRLFLDTFVLKASLPWRGNMFRLIIIFFLFLKA